MKTVYPPQSLCVCVGGGGGGGGYNNLMVIDGMTERGPSGP